MEIRPTWDLHSGELVYGDQLPCFDPLENLELRTFVEKLLPRYHSCTFVAESLSWFVDPPIPSVPVFLEFRRRELFAFGMSWVICSNFGMAIETKGNTILIRVCTTVYLCNDMVQFDPDSTKFVS